MVIKYYKTDKAVEAWDKHYEQVALLRKETDQFAGVFGGVSLIAMSHRGHCFKGVSFRHNPPSDQDLWTKYSYQNQHVAWPRARVTGREKMAALRELQERYKELKPKVLEVSLDPVFKVLGAGSGDFAFGGFNLFKHNGFIYIATRCPLDKTCVEILGSEYELAQNDKT